LAEGYDENGTFLSAIVGIILITTANGAMLGGIAIHIKYPLRWRWPALLIGVFLAVQVAFFFAPPPQAVEATVFGVKSIIWGIWMTRLPLFRSPRELKTGCAFPALVFVIDTLFYVARAAISLPPEIASHQMLSSILTTSNYLFGILCTFLLSTGFTL